MAVIVMVSRRGSRQLTARLCRALVVGLVLSGYLAAVLGIPLPVRAAKSTDRPFPCQGHSCGCQTAEQCWERCCCYSRDEKLAWARAHQVEPPAFVRTEPQGWRTPRKRDAEKPVVAAKPRRCCGGCAEKHTSTETPQVTLTTQRTEPVKDEPQSGGWLLGLSARQCQGHGTSWLTSSAAVPPAPATTWSFDWLAVGWLQPANCDALPLSLPPPAPPPRA